MKQHIHWLNYTWQQGNFEWEFYKCCFVEGFYTSISNHKTEGKGLFEVIFLVIIVECLLLCVSEWYLNLYPPLKKSLYTVHFWTKTFEIKQSARFELIHIHKKMNLHLTFTQVSGTSIM